MSSAQEIRSTLSADEKANLRRFLKEQNDKFADALMSGETTGDAVDADQLSLSAAASSAKAKTKSLPGTAKRRIPPRIVKAKQPVVGT